MQLIMIAGPHCAACKVQKPIALEWAKEHGVEFKALDPTDGGEGMEVATAAGVQAFPSLVAVEAKRIVYMEGGLKDMRGLERFWRLANSMR
jgi:thiol-disulfide isomerase/thioredoxin